MARLNAFRHGLAGAGALVAPVEDLALIAERTAMFARELGASGAVGELFAHRAALLATRMERAAVRDLAVVAANAEAARQQFDQEQIDALTEAISALDDPALAPEALVVLTTSPEGMDHLLAAWGDLRAALLAADPAASATATARARLWLDLDPMTAASTTTTELAHRIDAEIARLRGLLGSMDDIIAATDAARARAGLLAEFDPSREATLARRYEAAAERGMYRAIRAIADLRVVPAADLVPLEPAPTPPVPAPTHPDPISTPTPPAPSLGSFRAASPTDDSWLAETVSLRDEPASIPPSPRKDRPSYRQLHRNRR